MTATQDELQAILDIPNEMKRNNFSLYRAMKEARYESIRPKFTTSDLMPFLKEAPSIVDEWCLFSMDKRTSKGWYVREDGSVGTVEFPMNELRFSSMEEAVADFIVRELDYWTAHEKEGKMIGSL